MRWIAKPQPVLGTIRTRRKFLWFPRQYGRDCRWLEYAEVQEVFRVVHGGGLREPSWVEWSEFDFNDNRTENIQYIEAKMLQEKKN